MSPMGFLSAFVACFYFKAVVESILAGDGCMVNMTSHPSVSSASGLELQIKVSSASCISANIEHHRNSLSWIL